MQFFVEKNQVLTRATDPAVLRDRVPGFNDSMDAVADLRQQNRETGTEGWMYGREWRHVASISGPVEAVATMLDPEFLNRNGKKDFYRWLDAHKQYCTYDRRKHARRSNRVTFVNGKEI